MVSVAPWNLRAGAGQCLLKKSSAMGVVLTGRGRLSSVYDETPLRFCTDRTGTGVARLVGTVDADPCWADGRACVRHHRECLDSHEERHSGHGSGHARRGDSQDHALGGSGGGLSCTGVFRIGCEHLKLEN